MRFDLDRLAAIIAERARSGDELSYTKQLLDQGTEKCAKKLGEEAIETTLAALSGRRDALVAESADLLYHLLVLLRAQNIELAEIYAELERRAAYTGSAKPRRKE